MSGIGTKLASLMRVIENKNASGDIAETPSGGINPSARTFSFQDGNNRLFLYVIQKGNGYRLDGLRYIKGGCEGEVDGMCTIFEEGNAYTINTHSVPNGRISTREQMMLAHDMDYRFSCGGNKCTVSKEVRRLTAEDRKVLPDGLTLTRVNGRWAYKGSNDRKGVGDETAGKMNDAELGIEKIVDAALANK